MRSACGAAAAVLLPASVMAQGTAPVCKPSGTLQRLSELPEASGLVVSRASEGRLWSHNDSGRPVLHAFDANGKAAGTVTLTGAELQDWEALTIGPCGGGSCLYVGDIGDNDAKRTQVTIYRVPEPAKASGSAKVDGVFRATYPDGSHDAEALLVSPHGTLHIVTKGDTGHVALYRFPRELRAGTTMRLERVGSPRSKGQPAQTDRITDGAVSPDGEWVVLRTRSALTFYPAGDFFKGNWKEARTLDVRTLGEPQGEAVAFGPSNTIYIAGEGGGKKQPGTLAVLSCGK